jgi:hypothetical protein
MPITPSSAAAPVMPIGHRCSSAAAGDVPMEGLGAVPLTPLGARGDRPIFGAGEIVLWTGGVREVRMSEHGGIRCMYGGNEYKANLPDDDEEDRIATWEKVGRPSDIMRELTNVAIQRVTAMTRGELEEFIARESNVDNRANRAAPY